MSYAWYARNARTFWFWTIINNYIRESVVMASLQPIFFEDELRYRNNFKVFESVRF